MASLNTASKYQFVHGRDVAALQDPRPTCLIGACTDEGEVCFATVIWVTPLSHNPPMIAFALRAKSRTMEIIRETGCFSVSIPPADEEGIQLIEFCGNSSGHTVNKGEAVKHELVQVDAGDGAGVDVGVGSSDADDADKTGKSTNRVVPVVNHSYSWETGTIESIREAGDHLLAVGIITRAATCAPRNEHDQLTPFDSLLCVQHGSYAKAQNF